MTHIWKKSTGYTAPAELREVDETIPELFHGFCFVTPNIDIIEYIEYIETIPELFHGFCFWHQTLILMNILRS